MVKVMGKSLEELTREANFNEMLDLAKVEFKGIGEVESSTPGVSFSVYSGKKMGLFVFMPDKVIRVHSPQFLGHAIGLATRYEGINPGTEITVQKVYE